LGLSLSALFLVATFITALPIGLYFLQNPHDFFGRTGDVSIFSEGNAVAQVAVNSAKTLGMFFVFGDGNWRHNIAFRPELYWPVAIFFAFGIIGGFKKLIYRKEYLNVETIAFIWILVAAVPVVFSSEGIPHALRSILMLPAVLMLAACGASKIYNYVLLHGRIKSLTLRKIAVVVLILLTLEPFTSYVIWANNEKTKAAFNYDQTLIAEEINSQPKEVDKYVIVPDGGFIHMQTVVFLTNAASEKTRSEKNIYFVDNNFEIPQGSYWVRL